MMLSNAAVVNYILCPRTGDVSRIFIDKSLVGKLFSDQASDSKCGF